MNDGKIYRVFIASPGDVATECSWATEVLGRISARMGAKAQGNALGMPLRRDRSPERARFIGPQYESRPFRAANREFNFPGAMPRAVGLMPLRGEAALA